MFNVDVRTYTGGVSACVVDVIKLDKLFCGIKHTAIVSVCVCTCVRAFNLYLKCCHLSNAMLKIKDFIEDWKKNETRQSKAKQSKEEEKKI